MRHFLITSTIILFILLVYIFYDIPSTTQTTTIPSAQPTPTSTPAANVFTQEQLEQYYRVYENPYVIHIRTALDGYLDGSNRGIEDESVIRSQTSMEMIYGLDSFDRSYYKSKFIVLSVKEVMWGGKEITLLFQEKPDRIFTAWVYQLDSGEYTLRSFWEDQDITDVMLQPTIEQFGPLLNDREHAI